jgi:hypothetical protein
MLTDKDITNNVDFNNFIGIKNSYDKFRYINFHYMSMNNCKSLSNDFNELLLTCKYEYQKKLFPILVYLVEHFMEASKLKLYINDDIKWILAEEIKKDYLFIENDIFNST